jgi:hypothetical protein
MRRGVLRIGIGNYNPNPDSYPNSNPNPNFKPNPNPNSIPNPRSMIDTQSKGARISRILSEFSEFSLPSDSIPGGPDPDPEQNKPVAPIKVHFCGLLFFFVVFFYYHLLFYCFRLVRVRFRVRVRVRVRVRLRVRVSITGG